MYQLLWERGNIKKALPNPFVYLNHLATKPITHVTKCITIFILQTLFDLVGFIAQPCISSQQGRFYFPFLMKACTLHSD